MKIFFIFMGFFIVSGACLVYQGDMDRYMQAQSFLKATAEECAAGAALYYDEEAYAEGNWVFDYEQSKKYTEGMLMVAKKCMPFPKGSKLSYEMSFEDDLKGYEEGNIPTVQVTLTVQTQDLFRLPFLDKKVVMRKAKYELPEA